MKRTDDQGDRQDADDAQQFRATQSPDITNDMNQSRDRQERGECCDQSRADAADPGADRIAYL